MENIEKLQSLSKNELEDFHRSVHTILRTAFKLHIGARQMTEFILKEYDIVYFTSNQP